MRGLTKHAYRTEWASRVCIQAFSTLSRAGSKRLLGKSADHHAETCVLAECTPSCTGQVLGSAAGDLYTQASAEAFASSKQALQAFVRMAVRSPRTSALHRISPGQDPPGPASACRPSAQCCQSSSQEKSAAAAASESSRCQDASGFCNTDSADAAQLQRPPFCTGSTCPQEAAAVFSQLERMALSQQELGGASSSSTDCRVQRSTSDLSPTAQPPMQSAFEAAASRLSEPGDSVGGMASSSSCSPFTRQREPQHSAAVQPSPFAEAERFVPRRVRQEDGGPNAFAAAVNAAPFGRPFASPFDCGAAMGAASAPLSGSSFAAPSQCRSAFESSPADRRCCQPSALMVDGVDLRKELHIGVFLHSYSAACDNDAWIMAALIVLQTCQHLMVAYGDMCVAVLTLVLPVNAMLLHERNFRIFPRRKYRDVVH